MLAGHNRLNAAKQLREETGSLDEGRVNAILNPAAAVPYASESEKPEASGEEYQEP